VIPFDGHALLVMLLTFYPEVTRASLERAFRERPAYFAGGRLIGRHGEVLQLDDGRLFDLAFAAWTPESRWQVLDVTNPGPGDPEAFPLEPGPLTPIDPDAILPPFSPPVFEPLVAGHLAELPHTDAGLGASHSELVARQRPGVFDGIYEDTAGAAARTHAGHLGAIHEINPFPLLVQTDGLNGLIGARLSEYPDPESTAPPEEPMHEPRLPRPGRGPDDRPWIE
jgi:hypothetical protein